MNHGAARYYSSDEELGNPPSILVSMRNRAYTEFSYESSRLICSGNLTKKARGRSIIGRTLHTQRKRWFELRAEDTTSTFPKYMLFYFKKRNDPQPKGALKLTALDNIFFHEDCITEMTLHLENDDETESHQLCIQAENDADAERWIYAFQQSIAELNRLTVITEEEGGERSTSERTGQPIPGTRPVTERLDVNWGKGSKKVINTSIDGNDGSSPQSTSRTATSSSSSSSLTSKQSSTKVSSNADESGEYISRKKKREKLAELFKADESSNRDLKMNKNELFDIGWATVSGNGGQASSGKAYVYAMQHEYKSLDGQSSGDDSDSDSVRPASQNTATAKTETTTETVEVGTTAARASTPPVSPPLSPSSLPIGLPPPPPPPNTPMGGDAAPQQIIQEDLSSLKLHDDDIDR